MDSMKDVSQNMKLSGMLFFQSAFMEALYGQMPMCVAHAAHAAEIILKARISQEHPLLMFSKLPNFNNNENLTLDYLLEKGRTFSYAELPNQLWATTGIKIEDQAKYDQFGKLRNQIIHFSRANKEELDMLTLDYSLQFLDPLVESFWDKSVFDFIKRNPLYIDEFKTGLIEDKIINKGLKIDARIRRLLGEDSKIAWEDMQKRNREMDEQWESEEYVQAMEAQCEAYMEEYGDVPDNGQYEYVEEIHTNWNSFLNSF